jgi:dolichol-phosphate mannosyltransferase
LKIDYRKFTVILPTLNEKRTIGIMLNYLSRNYVGSKIIVVDDGSTDGTKEMVLDIAKRNPDVSLFDRHAKRLSRGLSASIIDGIMHSGTEYAIVLDADMQHPPGKVQDVAMKLIEGNDLVVANRARVTDWALYRKIISRTLMYLGKIILFIEAKETCVDIFSGFFGIKRDVFVDVFSSNKRRFVKEGYKTLFDFLKCVERGKLMIANVPFVFHIREFGKSKASVKQGMALLNSFFS